MIRANQSFEIILERYLEESNVTIPQSLLHERLEELKEHTSQLLNEENEMVLERIRYKCLSSPLDCIFTNIVIQVKYI